MRWERHQVSLAVLLLVTLATLTVGLLPLRPPISGDFSFGLVPRKWLRHAGAMAGVPAAAAGGVVCLTMGEVVLFGLQVLFAAVPVEIAIGSQRMATLVAVLWLLRLPAMVATGVLFGAHRPWYAQPPSVAWLAVALACCRRLILPSARRHEVLGIQMSDHTFSDVACLQILLLTRASAVPEAVVGFAVATIAMSDVVGLMRWVPGSAAPSLAQAYLASVQNPAQVMFADNVRRAVGGGPRRDDVREGMPTAAAVDVAAAVARERQAMEEERRHVETLQELGFSAGQCRAALRRARGDVNRASMLLFDGEIPLDAHHEDTPNQP